LEKEYLMNKTWKLFVFALLLCVSTAVAAPSAPVQPVQDTAQCVAASIFAPAVPNSASGDLFVPQPVSRQGGPVCQVFCVTTQCSSNAECTAAPNGRCNFACPGVGCCVYK
jgi:hypothetical protein